MRTQYSALVIPKVVKPISKTPGSLIPRSLSPLYQSSSSNVLNSSPLAPQTKKHRKANALTRRNSSISLLPTFKDNFFTPQNTNRESSLSKLVDNTKSTSPCHKREFTITIISNYGHPSQISCCSIDFLSVNSKQAKLLDISINDSRKNINSLNKLFNHIMTPNSEDDCWMEDWPPAFPRSTYTIKMQLECDGEINCLRIWPNTLDRSKNIKTAVVSTNDRIIFHGDFPSDFVNSINLFDYPPSVSLKNSPIINDIVDDMERSKRKYDFIPFSAHSIRFVPNQSYCGDLVFGLNQIVLFDERGNVINVDNKDVFLTSRKNTKEKENPDLQLFRPITQGNQTFLVESDICVTGPIKEGSCIEIAFRKMINVGCIFIINPNMSKDLRLTATKILSIYFDHKKMWTGRIRRRLADTMGETQSGAFAWFIEDKDYQAKVLANFPTRKFDTFF